MRWFSPQLVHLLWALPALLLLLVLAERSRRRTERALGETSALHALSGESGSRARWVRNGLVLAALGLSVLGLMRPQAGFRLVTTTSQGVDLVIALDLSRSMDARDARPDRLSAAKREILTLLGALEGSQIGLVEFAGSARIVSPLSTDREGLASIVETATTRDLDRPGTDLGAALEHAARLLTRPGDRPRAIVLVSDGENLEGDPRGAMGGIRRSGAKLYTMGLGATEGTTIPIVDTTGVVRGAKRDPQGKVVITRLDEGTLRNLAQSGGGRYERADGTGRAALRLVDPIGGRVRGQGSHHPRVRRALPLVRGRGRRVPHCRAPRAAAEAAMSRAYALTRPLALAVFAVLMLGALYEWGGPARRGVRELKAGRHEEALRALEAGRADLPGAAVIPYDEALAHLGKGEADSAEARFQEAMRLKGDPARAAAAYNLGNRAMRERQYSRAAEYYRDALRVKPDDLDTKKNLEEALRQMRQSNPEQRKSPPSGGQGPQAPRGGEMPQAQPKAGSQKQPPATPHGEFTREEAERWLQALEAERRARRQEGKGAPEEESGNRDW
jgi:Ca-activated chloride channel family protein